VKQRTLHAVQAGSPAILAYHRVRPKIPQGLRILFRFAIQ